MSTVSGAAELAACVSSVHPYHPHPFAGRLAVLAATQARTQADSSSIRRPCKRASASWTSKRELSLRKP